MPGCGRSWLIFLDDLLAGVYRVEPPTGADLARCRELQARYEGLPRFGGQQPGK